MKESPALEWLNDPVIVYSFQSIIKALDFFLYNITIIFLSFIQTREETTKYKLYQHSKTIVVVSHNRDYRKP